MNIIEALDKEQLRSDIPDFRAGDTVKVYVKESKVLVNAYSYLKAL